MPTHGSPLQNDTALDLELRKQQLELERLEAELEEKRRQYKRPWWMAPVLTSVGAIAVTLVGIFFGDSLLERNRADMRKDVLSQYFSIDNENAGKRAQVLRFVEAFLADDDPQLQSWVQKEKAVGEGVLRNLKDQKREIDETIKRLAADLATPQPDVLRTSGRDPAEPAARAETDAVAAAALARKEQERRELVEERERVQQKVIARPPPRKGGSPDIFE